MTPSEALAKLEADYDIGDPTIAPDDTCEVPGRIFDALLAVAKMAQTVVETMPKGTPDSLGGRLAAALAALGKAVSDAE